MLCAPSVESKQQITLHHCRSSQGYEQTTLSQGVRNNEGGKSSAPCIQSTYGWGKALGGSPQASQFASQDQACRMLRISPSCKYHGCLKLMASDTLHKKYYHRYWFASCIMHKRGCYVQGSMAAIPHRCPAAILYPSYLTQPGRDIWFELLPGVREHSSSDSEVPDNPLLDKLLLSFRIAIVVAFVWSGYDWDPCVSDRSRWIPPLQSVNSLLSMIQLPEGAIIST